jgi:hypothetical protein
LKQFVENYWIPDKRLLGGIETSILNPKCLKDVFEVPTAACSNIELIPEAAGRRRMWMNLESGNSRPPAPAPIPVSVSARGPGPIASVVPSAPQKEIQRKARAVAVEKMPDIYDLFDEQGFPISRASVQQFSLAQQLRESSGQEGVWVMVRWRNEFGGYEIISKISSK